MSRHYSLNQDVFRVLSPESAYALGFIVADGCLTEERHGCILSSKDLVILERIRAVLGSDSPISDRRGCNVLGVYGRPLYESLLAWGLTPRKSLTARLPDVGEALFPHLLRGYFDGDGTVTLKAGTLRMGFTSGARAILDDVAAALGRRLGMPTKEPAARKSQNAFDLAYHGQTALLIADLMYADAGDLCLERKRERFDLYRATRKRVLTPAWIATSRTEKTCAHCGKTKPTSEFGPHKRRRDGLNCYCRDCARIRNQAQAAKSRP
jgi:hypothetical protein